MKSPCINICRIEPSSRLCLGCLRSIDEITAWARLSDVERAKIMAELPARAAGVKKSRDEAPRL